jgi:sporadic carbohydrate cluster protein (TIGR04323 family)
VKKYAGYINLKNLNGVLYPSSIQNIMMKDYVQNTLKGIFYLSPTEVLQAKFPVTLKTLIGKETNVHGIVMLSSFYLPKNFIVRKKLYKDIIKMKKTIHFILDELVLKNKQDIEKIEELLIFNDPFFTNTKLNLNDYEKEYIKKYRRITFV